MAQGANYEREFKCLTVQHHGRRDLVAVTTTRWSAAPIAPRRCLTLWLARTL
jgi:hypothetical protein